MMPRYPMKPVPHGYFVAPVELLSDGSTGYAAGLVFYGDDEGDGAGEVIDIMPFKANSTPGIDRRIKVFARRDDAVQACEVHRHNR